MTSSNLVPIGIAVLIVVILALIFYSGLGGYKVPYVTTTVFPTTIPTNGLTTTTPTTVTTTIGTYNGTQAFLITEQEYSFSPNVIVATSGMRITFIVANRGGTVHNLLFQSGPAASTAPIPPGTNATITFVTPAPGNYTFYSNQRIGDRAQGMVGTLVVK